MESKTKKLLDRKAIDMMAAGAVALACCACLSGCGADIAVPKDPNGAGGIIMQDENTGDAASNRGGAMVITPGDAVDPGMVVEPGIGGSEGDVVAPDTSKNYM